jgi:hypothetical protein
MRSRITAAVFFVITCAQAQYTVEILHSGLVPAANSYGAGAGGGQQVGHTNLFLVGPSHALLWEGSAKSLVDLHPSGWDASYAMATDGKRQVGWRESHSGNIGQFATMWSGTSKSWVDLHDASTYIETNALGISGDVQVGVGVLPSETFRAVMWRNTAASITSLHPAHLFRSKAFATDGEQQVGHTAAANVVLHAALWTGTAESYVDLHPVGYVQSEALGVAGGQQVGFASFSGTAHAVLWRGTSGSVVDLNPGAVGEWGSKANATNGSVQVGLARSLTIPFHAAMWQGSASSYVNLHGFLPKEYFGEIAYSEALGIDANGNIFGWARHVPSGAAHAVLWRPVPETSPMFLLSVFTFLEILRRKRPWRC